MTSKHSSTAPLRQLSAAEGYSSPLRRFEWFQRLHAWALNQGNKTYETAIHNIKLDLLGGLSGKVLEIGPGAGANLGYFGSQVKWIGVEPNRHAHQYLRERALAHGLETEIHQMGAEQLPVEDASMDAVVSSLVLCTVACPQQVLEEIKRVLRPGGRFVFIEHVAAPEGTRQRQIQRLLRKPHALIADGCCTDRDTGKLIEKSGFSEVYLDTKNMPVPLVAPHIFGYAIR